MSKVKYPNPKFFRMKDHMDGKAQLANLKEVGSIIGGRRGDGEVRRVKDRVRGRLN